MATKKTTKKVIKEKAKKPEKYWYGLGRRKTSVARVRIYSKKKSETNKDTVNGKKVEEYFPLASYQNNFYAPFNLVEMESKFRVSVLTKGGGKKGQVEAIKLGISRALVEFDSELKKKLKDEKFLTRDSRKVERKKPGLKKARRAPQWQKR